MFIFLRHRRLSQAASALGSVIFVFSGFHIGHLNHVNFYTSTMLLPWLLIIISFFINNPSIKKSVLLALCGSAIALSGQPQIVLYTFLVAIITAIVFFISTPKTAPYIYRLAALAVLASVLALGLASFSILPLFEFLPLTERANDTPIVELLDFSYPPWNTITLIAPYFFGDHETYWGPKGFQELAGFTGIIPLLLIGAALACWSKFKAERLLAITLIAIGILGMLGKYSPFYSYLVNARILTSLNIPGRFIFFFLTGASLLAAIGLDDLFSRKPLKRKGAVSVSIVCGLAAVTIIFLPFFWQIQTDSVIFSRLQSYLTLNNFHLQLTIIGFTVFIALAIINSIYHHQAAPYLIAIIAASTLLAYGWHHNPLINKSVALAESPISHHLEQYYLSNHVPARIYTTTPDTSQLISNKKTDPISPVFSVHQPIKSTHDNLSCLQISIELQEHHSGTILFTIRNSPNTSPLRAKSIAVEDLSSFDQEICFNPILDSQNKTYFASFTSKYYSGLKLLYTPTDNPEEQAYFVRVDNPSPQELARSQKHARLLIRPKFTPTHDTTAASLARHLQVTANSSNTHWIGALSILPFRQFTQFFFADDREPIDGDGIHVVNRHRKIFNFSGVTHFIENINIDSPVGDSSFPQLELVSSASIGHKKIVLYRNPQALPKAFLVPEAVFKPGADETRAALLDPDFNPLETVFISGPKPPPNLPVFEQKTTNGTADIVRYDPTRVDIEVNTENHAWLVLTDSTTPEWHTYIDNRPAPYYIANSIFRTALVPPGAHTVSFRYHSPATKRAVKLTLTALGLSLLLIALPAKSQYKASKPA